MRVPNHTPTKNIEDGVGGGDGAHKLRRETKTKAIINLLPSELVESKLEEVIHRRADGAPEDVHGLPVDHQHVVILRGRRGSFPWSASTRTETAKYSGRKRVCAGTGITPQWRCQRRRPWKQQKIPVAPHRGKAVEKTARSQIETVVHLMYSRA